MYKQRKNLKRHDIELSAGEKNNLNYFISEELKYFNSLNEFLKQKVRHKSSGFNELRGNLRVFGEVIEHGLDLREIIKEEKIPKQLLVVEQQIRLLNEDAVDLCQAGLLQGNISKRTKRNLAVELLKFYITQSENTVGRPQLFLEEYSILQKRHVQLHRKALIVTFNEDDKTTLIKLPYLTKPIVIQENVKKMKWDIAIIHQQPGQLKADSVWRLDLLTSTNDYILDYLENRSPYVNNANRMKNAYKSVSF